MTAPKYILVDRDGVINEDSDHFIKAPEEWLPIPGSLEAIALFNRHEYKVAVITNQSGLARGLFDAAMLLKIHARMHRMVEAKGGKISAVYYCPHGPDDGCNCRKPAPGLLHKFSTDHRVTLHNIPFIGDSFRDIQAAIAAGSSPVLVKTGKGLDTLKAHPEIDIPVYENLYDAAKSILSGQ